MNEKEKTILKYEIDALSFSKGFEEETLNLIKEKKKSYKTGKIIRISMD